MRSPLSKLDLFGLRWSSSHRRWSRECFYLLLKNKHLGSPSSYDQSLIASQILNDSKSRKHDQLRVGVDGSFEFYWSRCRMEIRRIWMLFVCSTFLISQKMSSEILHQRAESRESLRWGMFRIEKSFYSIDMESCRKTFSSHKPDVKRGGAIILQASSDDDACTPLYLYEEIIAPRGSFTWSSCMEIPSPRPLFPLEEYIWHIPCVKECKIVSGLLVSVLVGNIVLVIKFKIFIGSHQFQAYTTTVFRRYRSCYARQFSMMALRRFVVVVSQLLGFGCFPFKGCMFPSWI